MPISLRREWFACQGDEKRREAVAFPRDGFFIYRKATSVAVAPRALLAAMGLNTLEVRSQTGIPKLSL